MRISTQADDYRYPGDNPVEYARTEIPPAIAALCVDSTKQLGLVISGIDFKISEVNGDWYCLEVNPMPGYSYYDRDLDGQIASALLDQLERCGGSATHQDNGRMVPKATQSCAPNRSIDRDNRNRAPFAI